MDGSTLVFSVAPTVIRLGPGHRDRAAVHRGQADPVASSFRGQLGARAGQADRNTSPEYADRNTLPVRNNEILFDRTTVPFRVLLDGQPPGATHGADADEQGHGMVTGPGLHQLIRPAGPITDGTFEITFLDPGAQALRVHRRLNQAGPWTPRAQGEIVDCHETRGHLGPREGSAI